MERKIELGKVDATGNGKKDCPAVLEVEVKENDGVKVFSALMSIYNQKGTHSIWFGQIFNEFVNRKLHNQLSNEKRTIFMKVKSWWDVYHLNDLNAGTIEQDKCLHSHEDEREKISNELIQTAWEDAQKNGYHDFNEWYQFHSTIGDNYDTSCTILKKYGMYEVGAETLKPYEKVSENVFKVVDGKKLYRYGCGWISREIPTEILNEMENFLKDL